MNIVLISVFKETIIGGISIHSSNLRDRLIAENHKVATVDFYSALGSTNSPLIKAYLIIRIFLSLILLRIKGYQLFHFHSSNKAPLFYLTALPLKLMNSRLLLSIHSGHGYDKWLEHHHIVAKANIWFFRALDRLIFMNNFELGLVSKRYPSLKHLISKVNPFIAPYVNPNLRVSPPKVLPLKVVTVGAFIPRYATEEVLSACTTLWSDYGIPVELTMIESSAYAQTEYKHALETKIASARSLGIHVDLIIDTQDVLRVMAGHHAFVRPARGDSYGLCVAEALLLGIPSIATDVCSRCANADLYSPGELQSLVSWLVARSKDLKVNNDSLLADSEDSYNGYLSIYNQVLNQ